MDSRTGILDEKKFSKYFILAVFAIFLAIFLFIIRPFLTQIIVAAALATLFYPLFKIILKLAGGSRGIASFLSCIIIVLSILLPTILISDIVIVQGIKLYKSAGPQTLALIEKLNNSVPLNFSHTAFGQWLVEQGFEFNWQKIVNNSLDLLGNSTAHFINKASKTALGAIFDVFVTVFSLFYFFKDGPKMLLKFKAVIPLSEEYKNKIVSTFSSMVNAIVKGLLFIGFLQAVLATLTLLAFGIKTWLLWGVVMLFTSVIPFVGTGPILIPAGIIAIISGHIWQGITMIVVSTVLISSLDNILRPRIVGSNADMHDLLVFFSMIGGMFIFGPMGLIVGPLIAAIFLTMLEIYGKEFKNHIEYSNVICNSGPQTPPVKSDEKV
jgi:predicted PurR-regulated permease PerM